jgi:hypothetical protein
MCLVIFVSEERLDRVIANSRARAKAWWYRHFPRIATWRWGPETPPPQYDEGTSTQKSQIKATTRPDSLTLPNYGGIRKHVGYQAVMDSSQKEMGQDD